MAQTNSNQQNHEPSLLSVIVPAFNCLSIRTDLIKLDTYLNHKLKTPYEVICVVDGLKTKRDKTLVLAKLAVKKNNKIKVLSYKENKGKGYAIRFGMAHAKGGLIAFIDSGGDLNTSGIGMALEHMKWYKADIIIGSKRHHASKVNYPWQRKILSFFVQRATRFFFGLDVSDTQTGLKVFKRKVLVKILPRLLVKRWAFDLEMLAVANRLGYTRIYESPVEIKHNFSSNVGFHAVQNFIKDYLAIIYRIYILRYYDDGFKDRWQGDKRLSLKYK